MLSQHVERAGRCCRAPYYVLLYVMNAPKCMPQEVLHVCAIPEWHLEAASQLWKLGQR
jgi:hypothetical protein